MNQFHTLQFKVAFNLIFNFEPFGKFQNNTEISI